MSFSKTITWKSLTVAAVLAGLASLPACGGGGASGGGGGTVSVNGPAGGPSPVPPAPPPGGGETPPPPPDGGETPPPPEGGGGTPPPGPVVPPVPGPAPAPQAFGGLSGVRAVTTKPDGTVYAVDETGMLFSLALPDATQVTAVAHLDTAGLAVEAIAYDADSGSLHVSADGRFWYRWHEATQAMSLVGAFPGRSDVRALAYDDEAQRLYGVSGDSRELLRISVDPVAGTPVILSEGTLPAAYADVTGLAQDRTTRRLYVADRATDRLVEVDTGGATLQAFERARLPRMDATDVAYLPVGDQFVVADAAAGELVLFDAKGHQILLDSVLALDYDASGHRLLGVHEGQAMLVAIHPENGWKEWVGWIGAGGIRGLAVDADGRVAYGVDVHRDVLVRIDIDTGAGADVGVVGGPGQTWTQVEGLAFDFDQRALYGVDRASGTLIGIDPNTGMATALMAWQLSGLSSLAYEPGTPAKLRACDDLARTLVTITMGSFVAVQEPLPAFQGIAGLGFDFERGVLWGTETATGSLVRVWEVPQPAAPAFTEPSAMAKAGGLLFVFDKDGHRLLRMDPDQGTVEPIADLGARQIEALTFQPAANRLFASDVTSGSLLRIDPVTGAVEVVGALGYADVRGLAYDETTGMLHGFDRATQKLLVINPSTAVVAVELPLSQPFADVQDLCRDDEHGTLIAVDAASRSMFQIDPVLGLVSMVVSIDPADARAIAYLGADVVAVLDAATDALVRIDRTTGATLP